MRKTNVLLLILVMIIGGCNESGMETTKPAAKEAAVVELPKETTPTKAVTVAEAVTKKKEKDVPVKHIIVYKEKGKFCGWPANYGTWSWGNEILVGFTLNYYEEKEKGHSYDKEKPQETVLSRSVDGGETWTLERHPELDAKDQAKECPGGIDFSNPDLAVKVRSKLFNVSYDRGKTWPAAYSIPKLGGGTNISLPHDYLILQARTDYIVNGKDDCMFFLTAEKTNGKEGRPFCARTTDGGKTIEFVSWICEEPAGFAIMPSTVRVSANQLVTAIRRKEVGIGFIEIYSSSDNGLNWTRLCAPANTGTHNGNPGEIVRLADGRLVLTFGYRTDGMGIYTKISKDNGKTWGGLITLRSDGRTWDIGYTQSVVRTDGKIVTVYYYTTDENPEQHIAATIWDPDYTHIEQVNQ